MNLFNSLLMLLDGRGFSQEEDNWVWLPEEFRVFTVKSMCEALVRLFIVDRNIFPLQEKVYGYLWLSPEMFSVRKTR